MLPASTSAQGGPPQPEQSSRAASTILSGSLAGASALGDIVGRDEELAILADFLDGGETGPAALLFEGEAGIGKTTVWKAGLAEASARSYRVLACRPSGAEAGLSFAALGDLLAGVVEEALRDLPSPLRRALEVALLLADVPMPPPDQRAIGSALLRTLRTLAAQQPLLVAVDDVHWIDSPTATVLEFAARRLGEERVGFLLSRRTEAAERAPFGLDRALPEERFRRRRVGPLSLGALHHLVRARLGRELTRPLLRHVHATSGGNPFFALEIARALERHGIELGAGGDLPLPPDLHELVHDRLTTLPASVQDVLRIVAALSAPTLALLEAATGEECGPLVTAAMEAHVLELDGARIRFTHPLLAQSAYAALAPAERRDLHRRLAGLVSDSEARARHLALAAEGPDAGLAEALDQAARRARARGATGAAAELREQARELTPPDRPEDRRRRTIEAALWHRDAGYTARARALLEEAAASSPPGPPRAEALGWLAAVLGEEADLRAARELYRQALAEAGGDHGVRARIERGLATTLFNLREDLQAAAGHARAAAAMAAAGDREAIHALEIQGGIEAILGDPAAASTVQRAVRLKPVSGEPHSWQDPRTGLAIFRIWADDFGGAREGLVAVYASAVERGDESARPLLLAHLSIAEWLDGHVQEAGRAAVEGYEVALLVDQKRFEAGALANMALVDAQRGRIASARAAAGEALALAHEVGGFGPESFALWALALLELSLGNPEAAHAELVEIVARVRAAGVGEPGAMRFVPDEIEALVALGRDGEAEELLDWFEERARKLDRASALARCYRCRGLRAASAGDPATALDAFDRALTEHERVRLPLELARTLLALGATQRRAKQKRAARQSLERALAIFEELEAPLWAERARAEFRRIGGRTPGSDELTPTEARVAALVGEGKTNREVAAALFVTVRTVEANLSRIYRKLGLRSRSELAHRLGHERRQTVS